MHPSIAALRLSDSLALLPRTMSLTPFFISFGTSSRMDFIIISIRKPTSFSGLPQFSSEKAKSERYRTPVSTAASVHALTLSIPSA